MSKRAGQYFVGQVSAKSRPHKAMISVKEQQQNAEEDDGSFTPSSNALGDRLRSDPKQRTPDENFTPSVSRTEQTENVGRLIASGQQYIGRFSDLAKNVQPKNNE